MAVARIKFARGFDGTDREVPLAYEVLDLRAALERVYTTDAHLVTYVARGAEKQPRINKTGIAFFEGVVETSVFFCDVDNAAHAEWDDDLVAEAMHQYEVLPVLSTAGVYHTAHGRRIVQPISEPIPVQKVEPYLKRWLLELEAAGLVVDWACRDWTRHFRLPHVRRGACDYRSPFVALDRMTPIALAPIADDEPPASNEPRPRRAIWAPLLAWTSDVPELWRPRVERIAAALADAHGNWHEMFLAIAGALLARRVPHEHIPALCRAISLASHCDDRTDDRERAGRSTVERHVMGLAVAGHSTLKRGWPAVADALDAALATGGEARLRAQAGATRVLPTRSLDETRAALEDVIRTAPDGCTLIKAECGLGKTRAVCRVAKERADKAHVSADAVGARAPTQSKTSISVDKNALALEVTRALRTEGASVRRLFGPLSVLREDGTPECRFHETARPLVEGGQSVQREFCQGRGQQQCEFYAECAAKDGADGPPNARITVGTHAMLSQLDAAAGTTGMLVIDEPPALLETTQIAVADFDVALGALRYFVTSYADAMRPALSALRAWTAADAPLEQAVTPIAAVRGGEEHVNRAELALACRAARTVLNDGSVADLVAACVRGAQTDEHRGQAPPIVRLNVFMARRALGLATELGTASRVLRDVRAALVADDPVSVRVEERGGSRVLLLTQARADVVQAVTREGPVVVADANAELHLPILEKVLGYAPPMHTFAAGDGAPIARTLLRTRAARRWWLPNGNLVVGRSVASAVSAALAWAAEDPSARDLGIVTFRPLEIALQAALRPTDVTLERAWKDAGQRPEKLDAARAALAPLLAKWPGRIIFGHYGAMRGLNAMKDVDALATLGDPWPHLGEIRHEVAFLELGTTHWEARLEALCRAELEQAHGRLRTVHRTRPGRALHIGKSLPGGTGWASGGVDMRRPAPGPARREAAMPNNELVPLIARLGGSRAAARLLGCSRSTIDRYVSGNRGVPGEVAGELRELWAGLDPASPVDLASCAE